MDSAGWPGRADIKHYRPCQWSHYLSIGQVQGAAEGQTIGQREGTADQRGPAVTTTVLTPTLTGLAADSWFAGGHSPRAGRRLAAVGLMPAGALAGALLLRVDVALPMLAAAVVIALVAAALRFLRAP